MKTFEMKADIRFQASDIDEAFFKLSEHFAALGGDDMAEELDFLGEINIEPIEEEGE